LVPSKPIKAPAVQTCLICSSTAGTQATSYPTAKSAIGALRTPVAPRRPLTVRDGCGPGVIAAVPQIAMAAHNAASALVAGEVL
jgi:predicted Rossmann-fold nucleotide-binding protein